MANRKARRKEKIKIDYKSSQANDQFNGLIKILGGILGIFIVFYLITILATNGFKSNNKKSDNDSAVTVIQYNSILAGETFNLEDTDYLVLFYDSKANDASLYSTLVSKYKQSVGALPIYIVDLHNGFNANCISQTGNPNAQDSASLKIKEATLINVKNHQNVKYIEGIEAIKAYL